MSDTSANLPAFLGGKEQMPAHIQNTGRGNENVGQDDMAMPYLNLLQALSPQVDEIDGAKAGLFINSITNELYPEVYVINLSFKRTFAVFKKRDLGGGFEGAYDTREAANDHIKDNLNSAFSDYDVQETHRHVCLLLDDEGNPVQPVIMNLQGTKVRVSKTWNSDINVRHNGADRFASVWKVGSRKMSNNQGSWYNLTVEFAGWAPEGLYAEAAKYFEQVTTADEQRDAA